jgi:hypothetical protein
MAQSALPAILAYRRGGLIANLVHFVDELPPGQSLNITSVEGVLTKYCPPYNPISHPREGVFPQDDPHSDDSA